MTLERGPLPLVIVAALLPGCFQEKSPRLEAPPMLQATATRAVEQAPARAVPVSRVAAVLLADEDPEIRRETVFQLADQGDAAGAAVIGQALTDPDPEVREAAIEALTGIRDETSADWLAIALGDPEPRLRRMTAEALGEIDGYSARLLLQQALSDSDESVRETAARMLAEPRRGMP